MKLSRLIKGRDKEKVFKLFFSDLSHDYKLAGHRELCFKVFLGGIAFFPFFVTVKAKIRKSVFLDLLLSPVFNFA